MNPPDPIDGVNYRRIFEEAPDIYIVLAPDPPNFTVQAVSDAYLRVTNTRREELVGRGVFQSFPEDATVPGSADEEALRASYTEVVEHERPSSVGTIRYDMTSEDSGGEYTERYWSSRSLPIFDEDGELLHILHRVDEVTDFILQTRFGAHPKADTEGARRRMLLVKPSRERRAFLRGLFAAHLDVRARGSAESATEALREHGADVVLTADTLPDTSGLELTRRIKEELGMDIPVMVRLEDYSVESYRKAYEAGADDVIGSEPNAREYISRVQAQLSAADLRAALEERSRKQYRQLFEQAPVGIALLEGPDHVFTLANPAYREIVGHRKVLGRPLRDAIPEMKHGNNLQKLHEVYETGTPYGDSEFELPLDTGGGEERTAYVTFAYLPFYALGGEVEGVAVFVYEVTELVEMRKEAEQWAEQFRRENQKKDEFLAMLGHELRNPLTPILHAASYLNQTLEDLEGEGEQGDPDEQDSDLAWAAKTITGQAEQLTRLVDDLLDIARISQGRLDIDKTVIDLSEVLETAVATVRPLIDRKEQTLVVDQPEGRVEIEADRERLVQVIANLLNNASKYSEAQDRIWLEAEAEAPNLVIRVRDEGRGLAEEDKSGIFDLFARADQTIASNKGGLGLGLALVKRLVEMHGGRVEARSDGRGRGSEFVVSVPVVQTVESPGESEAGQKPRERVGSQTRVLIIDDHTDVAEGIQRLLRRQEAQIRTANTGRAGLEMSADFQPDLILLDIGMPEMSGYEVAERLRDTPAGRAAMLVALTGYGRAKDVEEAMAAGFDRHLAKPPHPDELIALLEACRDHEPDT